MNLDESLGRRFARGVAVRLGRCPARCGLRDSVLVSIHGPRPERMDHGCLAGYGHDGGPTEEDPHGIGPACFFLRGCGRSHD